MARFVGTKGGFGAEADEFTLDLNARELPLINADNYLNDLLLKYCEATLAGRTRRSERVAHEKSSNAISSGASS